MKQLILLCLLATVCFTTNAQTTPETIIKKFFAEYEKNAGKALDELYATNPWTSRIKDGIENLKKEVNGYTVDYVGKYYGYEPIVKKQF